MSTNSSPHLFPLLMFLIASAIAGLLASCQQVGGSQQQTTVAGTITNRYTGQPVPGVPVTLGRRTSGFGYRHYDSLTTVYSDAGGRYTLGFVPTPKPDALVGETYVITVLYSKTYYDLTTQPYAYPWDGVAAKLGTANQIDVEVTPYKPVTIRLPTGKAGRNGIFLDFSSSDNLNWFGNIILSDSNRANQYAGWSKTIYVLPNRTYRFECQRWGGQPALDEKRNRRILYNDTTTVTFP